MPVQVEAKCTGGVGASDCGLVVQLLFVIAIAFISYSEIKGAV